MELLLVVVSSWSVLVFMLWLLWLLWLLLPDKMMGEDGTFFLGVFTGISKVN